MNLYRKCTAKPHSFLVTVADLALANPSHSRKNLLERIQKLIMKTDNKIRDEKLQTILTEKQQKYQRYHQVKLINMNILQVKKYCLLIKEK